MKVFKDNTAAKYTTRLPGPIDLDGDWEIALTEIIYPTKMALFVRGVDCTIRMSIRGEYMAIRSLPKDKYEDPTTLMNDFIAVKGRYFKVTYDEKTGAVEMDLFHPFTSVVLSDSLARILGFNQTLFEQGKVYNGKICIADDPSTTYVYCDLIEHVNVGDTRVPLLRTFGMEKKFK